MVYLICFFISTLLMSFSVGKQKKYVSTICLCVSILIPSILAAMRDTAIGTDIEVYVKPLFDCSVRSKNIIDFLKGSFNVGHGIRYVKDYELGFSLFLYILSVIFRNIHVVLFFIELIILIPIFIIAKKENDFIKSPAIIGTYFFMFYSFSLNGMRQSIAMSFVVLAVYLLCKSKYITSIIALLFSMLFHITAFIGAILYVGCLLFKLIKDNKKKNIIFYIIIATIPTLFFILPTLRNLLGFIGLERYSYYLDGEISLSIKQIILRIPIFWLLMYNYKNLESVLEKRMITIILVCDVVCSQLSSIAPYSIRVSYYFMMFYFFLFSSILKIKEENIMAKLSNKGIVIGYVILYWVYYVVLMNANETMPYKLFF